MQRSDGREPVLTAYVEDMSRARDSASGNSSLLSARLSYVLDASSRENNMHRRGKKKQDGMIAKRKLFIWVGEGERMQITVRKSSKDTKALHATELAAAIVAV